MANIIIVGGKVDEQLPTGPHEQRREKQCPNRRIGNPRNGADAKAPEADTVASQAMQMQWRTSPRWAKEKESS
jgi:hypothetical protein